MPPKPDKPTAHPHNTDHVAADHSNSKSHPLTGHGHPIADHQHHQTAPLHHAPAQPAKKGVGFDPKLKASNYEDSTRKGHLKPHDDKKINEELDLSGDHGRHIFCRNLHDSLSPLRIILKLIGRFPLSRQRSKDHKTYEYSSNCTSMALFHFNVTTLVLFYALITGLYNILKIAFHIPILNKISRATTNNSILQLERDESLIQRNAVPLIIVFTTLIQACISSVLFTRKHDYLAHIFSFLNKAAYTLHMDLADKARDFSVQSTVIFIIIVSIFIMFAFLRLGPSSIGTPTIFGSLMLHIFIGFKGDTILLDPEDNHKMLYVQAIGGLFLVVIFTASLAPILLFIHKCKLVRNAFAFWNGRAYCALLRGMEHAQTEETRTTYNILFKDHCILLDLLDSMDQMYSFTIESFFALQVISLFFQMYFFFRTGTESQPTLSMSSPSTYRRVNNLRYVRPYDWIPALLILFATSAILLSAGRAAAKVSEEAQAGMEVIRRKGLIGRRTDQELEFLYSMSFSFQSYRKMEISGAGYLYYNKGFIAQMIAVTLFCLFLLFQFRPLLDYSPLRDNKYQAVGTFLRNIEGTSDHNNSWANPLDDRVWAIGP